MNESAGTSGTGSPICHFVLRSTNIGLPITLQMSLTKPESATVFAQVRKQPGNTKVKGIGNDAFYTARTHTLQLRVAQTVVAMSAASGKSASSSQLAKLRADQIALGRAIAAQQ